MTKQGLVGVLAAFVVAVGVLWGVILANDWTPELGLDLQGGVSLNLEPAPGQEIDDEVLDQTVEVLRERIDALGVAEPDIARQGETVRVEIPGAADQQEAEEVVQETAILQVRPVLEEIPPGAPDYEDVGPSCDELDAQRAEGPPPDDEEVVLCQGEQVAEAPLDAEGEIEDPADEEVPPDQRSKFRLGRVVVDGGALDGARAQVDQTTGQWATALEFDAEGEGIFREFTGELACEQGDTRRIGIVLDGVVENAPPVAQEVECGQGIADGGQISTAGEDEARDLELVLRTGALPIQLELETSQQISPTLGTESLQAGLLAGAIGLALVGVYLVTLYRGIGLAAVMELLVFGLLVLGAITVLGQTIGYTLTLAGVAGVIVSIGIAADSSIIYRERYRDEIRRGRTIRTAAETAFSRAFRTNLTGNTVSFIGAVVLWFFAVGPVQGFAFALGLSTLIDTVLFGTFTRSVFGLVANNRKLARSPWVGLRADTFISQPVVATADRGKS
ncbi:protein translocase subunit SecD [Egibacter rhizosphaerae]|uniref:Protein translocase subunit SecD n=1 Tax=Egibacter rhizosphaerae TaxID=1670831 RepID=A0A411YJT8_9ACTN|nr:protein translocase subunit SecD [Egibacter rhizosphaerae]QBI21469.1 protein translocase subunit SecD [Egibacter rhizosphaerae]